ncbi:MAG: substrate-binding domain-containing protein [Bacillota bacterium]|nr:substrate-binding domain-containing protein [Bacillota bacterium]
MKKLLCILALCLSCWLGFATAALADAGGEEYVTVSWAYTEDVNLFTWREQLALQARYADDKTPIPLNAYYDGYMFATIPAANAERPLEAYMAEALVFIDADEQYYEFFVLEELSRTGIIRGNANGEALPFDTISRAEAVTLIVRMLGLDTLEAAAPSGFADVPAGAWYAETVAIAEDNGVISSDELFNPQRQVSREEFTTMLARAMERTGLQTMEKWAGQTVAAEEVNAACNIVDGADISDWARAAYMLQGTRVITTGLQTLELAADKAPISQYYAVPQQAATRYECALVLRRALDDMQVYPSRLAIQYGFDQAMPVIDGSTSTYPFTEAVYGALFSNGYRHPDKPASHSKSHASYERLIAGEVDMLFASVYPASDILALAQEKGVELELIPIAYDAMVFFTNTENPASGLTSQQITDIYVDNAYDNWQQLGGSDAQLIPYARNLDSGSQAQMERHFLGGETINATIQQETTSITMSNILTDVMGAYSADPPAYALGYSIYYYYHNMDVFYDTLSELKLLAIDGVYPTDKTIADGSYPLANNTYIVLRADTPEDSPARQMVKFMLSPAGQSCVEQAGYGPLQ